MTATVSARLGALSMFLAVACGAFGAHALKSRLSPEMLAVWETAVRYQVYHALALLVIRDATAAWCFALGTLLFSGSLYGVALGARLGMVTPVGGLLFLIGWAKMITSVRS